MKLSPRGRRYLLLGVGFTLVGALVVALVVWPRTPPLPRPGSPAYEEYLRAFQVGEAALDAGREDLARAKLERAVELIPGEPAGWANLALLNLRQNDLGPAASSLNRARVLSPDSGEIEALLGLLAEKQGRLPEAVAHLRKAVEKDPRDLPSLFTLAETVSKEGGPDSDAEYQRLMEQILKVQPNNLPVLVLRADTATRRKDQAAFKDTLDRLAALAPGWSPESRNQLDEVRKAVVPGEGALQLQLLDNVLKTERGYARDSLAIRPRPGVVGTPVRRFLRLQPVRPTPAPPDEGLTFTVAAWSPPRTVPAIDQSRWDVVVPVWIIKEAQRAALTEDATGGLEVRAAEAFASVLFVANAREVRRADTDAPALPFPGGAKSIAPTSSGVLPLDWDNDFRIDLVLAGAGGLRFFKQQADGSFADVTGKTGLPAGETGGDCFGAWAADIDMDGDLDVVVARRSGAAMLLRNNRDGTFKVFETFAAVKDARAFVWADLDNDGAADAAILDATGKLHVFANERSGQFSPWPTPEEPAVLHALTAGDINGDGTLDLVALRSDGAVVRFSDQDKRQPWQVSELNRWPGPMDATTGTVTLSIGDVDNNGALDLIVAGRGLVRVFLADEQGKVAVLSDAPDLRMSALLDMDRDGRLDLIGVSAEGKLVWAQNKGRKGYRWQAVWPLANPRAGDDRINSFAVGGEVEVRSGPLVQKQPIAGPAVHFGLGEQTAADIVRIVWPNGAAQVEFEVPADRLVTAAQRLSGSCPFLFAWDGTGMRFVADFMWGTPLGMYINGQDTGPLLQTTEWIKIRGDQLAPRDGYYDLRVNANLWETDYFDQLALIVVDHPPDTEVYADERFFLMPTPPSLTVTTPARPVSSARDHLGKDATELVNAIDGRYLDRCGRGRFQGVTRDHWVEVDLGDDAPREGPLLLIARGWLHPTNSSINFALTQGQHDPPRGLVLEVPDGKGGWKVGRPGLGFPAGKDKTMLVRLDGIDGPGVSCRFRLRTSMEIFWDFLGFARELDPKLARLHRPAPLAADLRYRGVLEMTQKDASSPELPHYDRVMRGGQPWRDLTGYYTRFGDVRELLEKVEDRYVIMNAGDEIALRFPVPPAPPPGWRRDFLWECDGWTRDGDLNTRSGNTVLPLPAHGVKTDDRRPGRLEDDPVYRRFPRDWWTYHTRHVTPDEFARGLRR